ncbi:hypothetical protein MMC28_005926 [Mycoblastus sanguinarius]|nr:hypothetical protein [Mycoblastus sanguinarius]
MTTSFPPCHHHSSRRIPQSEALSLLSAYLEAAATDPSLHPNALLTENGPVAPSSGSNTGLVLHNLKRVEAGLKGEHLAADLAFNDLDGDGPLLPDLTAGELPASSVRNEGQTHVVVEDEWQDREQFEREQEVVQGEIGKRDNSVEGGIAEGGQVPMVKATASSGDTDAKKKAKKERLKKERMEREAQRRREKNAED